VSVIPTFCCCCDRVGLVGVVVIVRSGVGVLLVMMMMVTIMIIIMMMMVVVVVMMMMMMMMMMVTGLMVTSYSTPCTTIIVGRRIIIHHNHQQCPQLLSHFLSKTHDNQCCSVLLVRERQAILSLQHSPASLTVFSGDIFSPAVMSTFTKGEQMLPLLAEIQVEVACYGNHDFDYGQNHLIHLAQRTSFPWLMSNAIRKDNGRPLAEGKDRGSNCVPCQVVNAWWWCCCDVVMTGKIWHVVETSTGVKVGFIGLIELGWIETLPHLCIDDIIYTDYVIKGRELAAFLREEQGVGVVIALTHMRDDNDHRLVREVPEIDLVLGGHDHHHHLIETAERGVVFVKSGSDFKEFSRIDMTIPARGRPFVVSLLYRGGETGRGGLVIYGS